MIRYYVAGRRKMAPTTRYFSASTNLLVALHLIEKPGLLPG